MNDKPYPAIDRADFTPNFHKTLDNEQLDIAWGEGALADGRPVRVECWACDQMTFLTYYFSALDLGDATPPQLKALLVAEGLIAFDDDKFHAAGYSGINADSHRYVDPSGNDMWVVTVLVGDDEDGTFVRDSFPLEKYPGRGVPVG